MINYNRLQIFYNILVNEGSIPSQPTNHFKFIIMKTDDKLMVQAFLGLCIIIALVISLTNTDRINIEPLTFFVPLGVALLLSVLFSKTLRKSNDK